MAAPTPLGLTSSWVSLGPGPMLVRVLSGTAVFLSSATTPSSTASGGTTIVAAVGDDGYVVQSTAECWVKGVSSGATINYLPLPSITASSAASSSIIAPATVAVSQITLLQAIDATLSSLVDGFQALVARVASPAQDGSVKAITAKLGTLPAQDASLEAIATKLGAPAQDASFDAIANRLGSPAQDGADVTGVAMPAGGIGIRGWLSAIYKAITGTVSVSWSGQSVGVNNWPASQPVSGSISVSNFPAAQSVSGTFWQTTQPVSLASSPLPPGAATDASLLAIKAAIQAQLDLATSVWTDGTNFYVRREVLNEVTGAITVSFTNPDGSASTATAAGLKPVTSDNALTLQQAQFDVTQAGTGTVVGDVLARIVVVNKAVTPPTASSALWLNLTQGTTLASAPAAAAIAEQTQHLAISSAPANLAQDASLQSIIAKLGALGVTVSNFPATQAVSVADGQDATLGSKADAPVASGPGSVVAQLKGILARLTAGIGVTGTFWQATQPVSSTDGALATIGTTTDAATASGAATSVIGALRAIRDKLLGSIAVTGTFWQATQPVSMAVAPLPPGAATDASLLAIKAAIQAQLDLATSVWTDGTNFYVRRDTLNEGTGAIAVTFTNPDGSAAAVSASGLKPVASDNALTLQQAQFDVTQVGTGMAVGDVLARIVVVNKAVTPPTASSALWLNLTQGTTLAGAPAAAAVTEQTQHLSIVSAPANLAQDASLQSILAKLIAGIGVTGSFWQATQPASIADGQDVTLGSKADAAATAASTSGSAIAWLRGILVAVNAATPAGTNTIGMVGPAPRAPASGSTTTAATTSTQLWPANATRAAWTIQAPQAADVWINPLGGACGVGLVDCFRIPAGGYAKSTAGACETSAFTYYCATGGLVLTAYQL